MSLGRRRGPTGGRDDGLRPALRHETAIHWGRRAIALDLDFALDGDVAMDAVDEWLELGCLPFHFRRSSMDAGVAWPGPDDRAVRYRHQDRLAGGFTGT
jgi:hypothetical protein